MTYRDGFDRTVSDWLDEQAGRGAPGYLDEILTRTTRTRQRPAWSSLERWLPMQTTARFAPVPRIAWLAAMVLALALAFGAALLVVGSRPHPLPVPFGPARDGTLLYGTADGDIAAYDVATGTSHPLLTGPEHDSWPWFSRDGTLIKVERQTDVPGHFDLLIGNADGTDLRPLVRSSSDLTSLDWSADGSRMALVGDIAGVLGAYIIDVDGKTPPLNLSHMSDPGLIEIDAMEFRPDGRELVATTREGITHGLYAIHPDGTGLRLIATSPDAFDGETLSPDGTKVAYSSSNPDLPITGVLHIVDVQTGHVSTPVFDGPTSDRADLSPVWSPDGTRLAFDRYSGGSYHVAVAPVAGGHVTEIGPAYIRDSNGNDKLFSPDGKDVIVTYQKDGATWLLDAAGGAQKQLSSSLANGASWQRLGP